MMTTKKLIEEALSLPVEERALIADSLLRSLNVPDTAIDTKWTEVAKRRLQELRSGRVKPIPGDEVFSEVLKRLCQVKYAFHPEAKAEFLAAIDYYEDREPGLGSDFAIEVHATIENILSFPNAWPILEDGITTEPDPPLSLRRNLFAR